MCGKEEIYEEGDLLKHFFVEDILTLINRLNDKLIKLIKTAFTQKIRGLRCNYIHLQIPT